MWLYRVLTPDPAVGRLPGCPPLLTWDTSNAPSKSREGSVLLPSSCPSVWAHTSTQHRRLHGTVFFICPCEQDGSSMGPIRPVEGLLQSSVSVSGKGVTSSPVSSRE